MATIYQCLYHGPHGSAPTLQCCEYNQGKRAKCRGCGSSIRAIEGHAIIAKHRGDGNYSLADSIREYATMAAANKAADRLYQADNSSGVVARFVTG